MRISSLKHRITFIMVFSLLIIFTVIGINNHQNQNKSISELNNKSTSALLWSINNQIEFIMLNGANEELQPIAEEAVSMGIIDELTIVNDKSIVTSSSDTFSLQKLSRDPIWQDVFKTGQNIIFDTVINDVPLQYSYLPFRNMPACLDCHNDKKADAILGGMKIIKSKKAPCSKRSAAKYSQSRCH